MKNFSKKIIKNIKSEYNYIKIKPKPLVFDHIPKCAGTAVYDFVSKYYSYREKYGTGVKIDAVNKFKNSSEKKRYNYKLISGHLTYLLLDYVRQDAIVTTVFREPIDRIISHYYYAKMHKGHYLHKRAFIDNNFTVKEYCTLIKSVELNNFYIRRFSGLNEKEIKTSPKKAIAQAYDYIDKKYDIVGFQDNIPYFMDKLIEKTNLPKGSYKDKVINKSLNKKSVKDLDTETINVIGNHNSLDIELYEKLRKKY